MKFPVHAVVALGLTTIAVPAFAQGAAAKLDCQVGPVTKTFGGTPWLVYSCADQRTVILTAAPGSPAAPFNFILAADGPGHRLVGEGGAGGGGDGAATDRAFKELKALPEEQIQRLVEQTRQAR